MSELHPTPEQLAFMELKGKIVQLMFDFTEKHCGPEESLYPRGAYIIVDVLTACLEEAQYQVVNYQPFTYKQIDHICYQIGDWYLLWRGGLTDPDVPHRLGVAKEQLKTMICGD